MDAKSGDAATAVRPTVLVAEPPANSTHGRLRGIVIAALLFAVANLLYLQQTQLNGLVEHAHSSSMMAEEGIAVLQQQEQIAAPQPSPVPQDAPVQHASLTRAQPHHFQHDKPLIDPLDNETVFAMSLWNISHQQIQQPRGIVLPLYNGIATLGMSLILELRIMDVDLPIEVPHCGDLDQKFHTELTQRHAKVRVYDACALAVQARTVIQQEPKQLFCKDLADCRTFFRGFNIKILAVVLSQFDEVMLMDADTLYFQSPMLLWDTAQYKATGTFFFNDRVAQEHTHLGRYRPKTKITKLQHYLSTFDITPYRPLKVIARSIAKQGPAAVARRTPTVPLDFVPSDYLLTSHSWNRRTGHQVDSSLLLWHKTRQPRATAMLASFISLMGVALPPGYGDKEQFFMACEMAETQYAFSDVGVGAIGIDRRVFTEADNKKSHLLCGDAVQYVPDQNYTDRSIGGATPLYFNGDHIFTWQPGKTQMYRTKARKAEFYPGSNVKRRTPLICPLDTVTVTLGKKYTKRIEQRQKLHGIVLEWFIQDPPKTTAKPTKAPKPTEAAKPTEEPKTTEAPKTTTKATAAQPKTTKTPVRTLPLRTKPPVKTPMASAPINETVTAMEPEPAASLPNMTSISK